MSRGGRNGEASIRDLVVEERGYRAEHHLAVTVLCITRPDKARPMRRPWNIATTREGNNRMRSVVGRPRYHGPRATPEFLAE